MRTGSIAVFCCIAIKKQRKSEKRTIMNEKDMNEEINGAADRSASNPSRSENLQESTAAGISTRTMIILRMRHTPISRSMKLLLHTSITADMRRSSRFADTAENTRQSRLRSIAAHMKPNPRRSIRADMLPSRRRIFQTRTMIFMMTLTFMMTITATSATMTAR